MQAIFSTHLTILYQWQSKTLFKQYSPTSVYILNIIEIVLVLYMYDNYQSINQFLTYHFIFSKTLIIKNYIWRTYFKIIKNLAYVLKCILIYLEPQRNYVFSFIVQTRPGLVPVCEKSSMNKKHLQFYLIYFHENIKIENVYEIYRVIRHTPGNLTYTG